MNLGERLKIARENKGVSQTQVHKDIGVNNKTLSGYERNISEPDLKTLELLSDYYNVSIDYLLGRTSIRNSIDSEGLDFTQEELELFEKIKSDPEISVLFHGLKDAPKKKIKQLLKTWEFINEQFEEMCNE